MTSFSAVLVPYGYWASVSVDAGFSASAYIDAMIGDEALVPPKMAWVNPVP